MVVALKPTDHADAAVSLEPDPIGARLVDALYAFWWRLRELYPELPSDVLIRIGEPPRRRKIGGHFRASCWIRRDGRGLLHEVMVTGQVLKGGGKLVAMLLAHEAVHAVAEVLGIKDTGERDWHNKAFKRLAETKGQIVHRIKGHGFWGTELGEELEAQLTDAIAELDAAIDVYLKADERPPVVRLVKKRKKEPIDDGVDDIDEDDRVDEEDIEDEIDDGTPPPSDPPRRRATGRNLPCLQMPRLRRDYPCLPKLAGTVTTGLLSLRWSAVPGEGSRGARRGEGRHDSGFGGRGRGRHDSRHRGLGRGADVARVMTDKKASTAPPPAPPRLAIAPHMDAKPTEAGAAAVRALSESEPKPVFEETWIPAAEVRPFDVGSVIIQIFEDLWREIVRRNPALEAVVFITGLGYRTKKLSYAGQFCGNAWFRTEGEMAEIFIAGESLKDGLEIVLATLLHEGAHALANRRGIEDTSRQGRYHNKRYKPLGEELGLLVDVSKSTGYSETTPAPGTLESYRELLEELSARVSAHRLPPPEKPTKQRVSRTVTMNCPKCLRRLKLTKKQYKDGPIACGNCDNVCFEPEEGPDD